MSGKDCGKRLEEGAMIGDLVPRGCGEDGVDDLYGTGVCLSQDVVQYGMDGMRTKALKNLQETVSIR